MKHLHAFPGICRGALALVSALSVAAGPASAEVLVVPGDFPTLAQAVDAAWPGDTILVQTDADQGTVAGIVVDKPLTIVGDPICTITPALAGGLILAGPGSGEVELVGLDMRYAAPDSDGRPFLTGGGFDQVRVIGSRLCHDNFFPTGLITAAYPAIELSGVQQLLVVDSFLLGGGGGADSCVSGLAQIDGAQAILAPEAVVIAIDSQVIGGRGAAGYSCCASCVCPADLFAWGGTGGDGVVAAELHAWGSIVTGGMGADWWAYPEGTDTDPQGDPVHCGMLPMGAAFVGEGTLLSVDCSRLTASATRIPMGGQWTLAWDGFADDCVPAPGTPPVAELSALYLDFHFPVRPYVLGGEWAYLDARTAFPVGMFPFASSFALSLRVPVATGLIGLPVTAQVLTGSGALSGPVTGLLLPALGT